MTVAARLMCQVPLRDKLGLIVPRYLKRDFNGTPLYTQTHTDVKFKHLFSLEDIQKQPCDCLHTYLHTYLLLHYYELHFFL